MAKWTDVSFLSSDAEGFNAEGIFFFQTFGFLPSEMCKPVVSCKPVRHGQTAEEQINLHCSAAF